MDLNPAAYEKRGIWNGVQTDCNCEYSCLEAPALGSTSAASRRSPTIQKVGIAVFGYLYH
jgi:hypothetical protein